MPYRRAAALVLASVLLLAACSPTSAVPNPSGGTFPQPTAQEPAKLVSGDSLTICLPLPEGDYSDLYEDHIDRLQKLFFGAGWKVHLSVLKYKVPENYSEEGPLMKAIWAQVSAGQAPDAWHVPVNFAQKMREEGLTLDMADVLPSTAPMLWQTCKAAFPNSAVVGAPMSLGIADAGGPTALLMSTGALTTYGKPIASAEDILTYLEQTTDRTIGGDALDWALTDAWAAQQGYTGLPGLSFDSFYARMDDPDCKIVPVEDIPGFGDLYLRFINLGVQKRLWGLVGTTDGGMAKLTGMLVSLHKGAQRHVQAWMDLMGKDITALPLAGCTLTSAEGGQGVCTVLAVSAISTKADAVAAFAQWALLDPGGYDLCTLGQPGTDYRLVDDRVEYLTGGKPLEPADWDISLRSPVFHHFESYFVCNPNLQRFTVYEASNADQVLASYRPVAPVWKLKESPDDPIAVWTALHDTQRMYRDVLGQRRMDLTYMVSRTDNIPEFTPEQVLQRLQDNRPKLKPFLEAAQAKVKELLQTKD